MKEKEVDRVVFYSKEDGAGVHELKKAEPILRSDVKSNYTNINEVIELYHIKKYIDNDLLSNTWSNKDITEFKQKVKEFGKAIGRFIATINDSNINGLHSSVKFDYISSFWELINNQEGFKRISKPVFSDILSREPHIIFDVLTHRKIVEYYDKEISTFLLTYPKSAEILLSAYEVKEEFFKSPKFIPKGLSIDDKESILSKYLDSEDANPNYIALIQNARDRAEFKISGKTRLKAKRRYTNETEKFLKGGLVFGVSVCFLEQLHEHKYYEFDSTEGLFICKYFYSLDFVKRYHAPYSLFQNFNYLFEYTDHQHRITLVSKKVDLSFFEIFAGVPGKDEYRIGIEFHQKEMASHLQLVYYYRVLEDLGISLENLLHQVFSSLFQEKFKFPENAYLSMPTATSEFEKVNSLAPEFERMLKQFKLFVEEGNIDFELLEISSNPITIKHIPSLNQNKYLYINERNEDITDCMYLLFSDQTLLTFVGGKKRSKHFFGLLQKDEVTYNDYKDPQKVLLNKLIKNKLIHIDDNGSIQIENPARVVILKDLYVNKVGSFYHYPDILQQEVKQMEIEKIILFDNALFSKPEQDYFNYYLNKSEFTNGIDLRNSYLHGTQARPEEVGKHQYAYFTYLKLLILALLKIDDDLTIYNKNKKQQE